MGTLNINRVIAAVRKAYGPESAVLARDPNFHSNPPYWVSTQSLALDFSFGRPGFPGCRILEIAGEEGSGKSTLAEHIMAEFQQKNGVVILAETETGRDVDRMVGRIGVREDELVIVQPKTIEEGFDLLEACVVQIRKQDTTIPILTMWDSIAATQAEAESERGYDDKLMAEHAKVISHAMRKLIPLMNKLKFTAVFINQLKTKMAEGYIKPQGDARFVTFGGKAIAYAATISMRVKRGPLLRDANKKPYGYICYTRTTKNKVGSPFQDAQFDVKFRSGIDKRKDLLSVGITYGFIQERGRGHFELGGKKFTRNTWVDVLKELGRASVTHMFVQAALKQQHIKPYGVR